MECNNSEYLLVKLLQMYCASDSQQVGSSHNVYVATHN